MRMRVLALALTLAFAAAAASGAISTSRSKVRNGSLTLFTGGGEQRRFLGRSPRRDHRWRQADNDLALSGKRVVR